MEIFHIKVNAYISTRTEIDDEKKIKMDRPKPYSSSVILREMERKEKTEIKKHANNIS
jgi:hypothetical protein